MQRRPGEHPHSSHWGTFLATADGDRVGVRPHPDDPDPAPILANIPGSARHGSRVARPTIRRGWLERGPGPDDCRGTEPFVEVPWDEALDMVAGELERVRRTHGNEAVYGGSYGWASAGRFHHAQSQLHRFLNLAGGYVASRNTYSAGAAEVILPRVLAPYAQCIYDSVGWEDVIEHGRLVVAFGGMPARNRYVHSGGPSRHRAGPAMRTAVARGVEFLLVSPLRDDLPDGLGAAWLAPRPGTDTALMLGIAHTLVVEGLHDRTFLDRCTTGYDVFERYLLGVDDGTPKDAAWAGQITDLAAEAIVALARQMAAGRTLITVAHGLQRAEHGEQPIWMAITLAAILGQIGLPGGGFGYALGIFANHGERQAAVDVPALPQGRNPVRRFIPVARVADMLLDPGGTLDYDGTRITYPDIRLVYWAGGNPFHHHQDLGRLRRAFGRPDTIVVHEPYWTATARHADIVLPSTVTLERDDIGASRNDPRVVAMHRVLAPYAEARDDFGILRGLAARLGFEEAFTGGLDPDGWLHRLYGELRDALVAAGADAPAFEAFWEAGDVGLPERGLPGGWLRRFREDPSAHPLGTPSGRIEIASATIASFGYADCPGHPAWLEGEELLLSPRASAYPLQLVANQPAGRLHSQLDFGAASMMLKRDGREVLRLHPAAAAERGIADGDTVRVHNDRGAYLAVAVTSDALLPAVVQGPTGAWFDPEVVAGDQPTCLAGNPNAVTRDRGTSSLAQGCTGQLVLVEVERIDGAPPARGHRPPEIADRPR